MPPASSTFTPAPPQSPCAASAAPLPLVSRRSRDRAEAWMKALLPALERWGHPGITHAELERNAVEAAERILGERFSARHVRNLLARAMERDAGQRQFARWELYLDRNARPASTSASLPGVSAFDDLLDALTSLSTLPSAAEEAGFLLSAWRVFQGLLLRGLAPKKAKADLLQFLWERAPWLSDSRAGLTQKIIRKFRAFAHEENPAALMDGRAARAGEKRAPAFQQDHLDRITYTAARRGRRVAQAIDDLLAEAETQGLPGEFVEFLITMRGPGSRVNERLMRAVKPDVDAIAPYFLGKKAIDDATAPLRRCYDKLRSMSVVCADDFTLNAYFSVPDGKGWFDLTRGQVLLFMDVRSRKFIGRALIPERNYDSHSIRTGMNVVCRNHGIPPVWLFERGIWKRSHVVKGTAPKEWQDARSSAEFQFGWESLGSRFIHATRARSKPIEGMGSLLQNLMDGCRGACGRDERRDCPDETKRAKLAVEARREHPDKFFDTFDQWEARLDQFIDRYNARPQGGLLGGKSPDEVFEQQWPHDDPPTRLDAASWHLGAHYVREFTVGNAGLAFRIGKNQFAYFDESLSALRGRRVLAWFDPELPDQLAVTGLDKRNPILVQRSNPVDFLAALEPEDSAEAQAYRDELAKQHGYNAHPKARFKALSGQFRQTFRHVVTDSRTAALAKDMLRQRGQHQDAQRAKQTRQSATDKRARKLGIASVVNQDDAHADEGTRMMEQAARAMEGEEQ